MSETEKQHPLPDTPNIEAHGAVREAQAQKQNMYKEEEEEDNISLIILVVTVVEA